MAKTLDTLRAKEVFTKVGFDEAKAKALVRVMSEIDDDLARKQDVLLVRAEIDNVETRITNRFYAIGLTIAALVVGMNTVV